MMRLLFLSSRFINFDSAAHAITFLNIYIMETTDKTTVTVEATVNAPVEKTWKYFTAPEHITRWCFASDDWHAPFAENDVRTNGKFKTRMEAKDGSAGFDFEGVYDMVEPHRQISYKMGDGRKVDIRFSEADGQTRVKESFEAESVNSVEMQKGGWQSILDNFKRYTEQH
jgi:uncharacterized protein YndB with AHSA1/START domain